MALKDDLKSTLTGPTKFAWVVVVKVRAQPEQSGSMPIWLATIKVDLV